MPSLSRPRRTPSADAPLQLPRPQGGRIDLRREAGRQLQASLWMIGIMTVALAAMVAARPAPVDMTARLPAHAATGQAVAAVGTSSPTALR